MSLLTTGAASISANILQEKEIVQRVTNITQAPIVILQSMYFTWAKAFTDLWGDYNLTPILLEKIGNQAVELFDLNTALTQFMISQLSGIRDDIVADINNKFTLLPLNLYFHEDGTMTASNSTIVVPELSS